MAHLPYLKGDLNKKQQAKTKQIFQQHAGLCNQVSGIIRLKFVTTCTVVKLYKN